MNSESEQNLNLTNAVISDNFLKVQEIHQQLTANGDNSFLKSTQPMDYAASGGHLDILEFLHKNGYRASIWAMNWAARGIVKEFPKLDEDGNIDPNDTTDYSKLAEDKGLKIIQWLIQNCNSGCSTDGFYLAQWNKRERIYAFLIDKYPNVYQQYVRNGILKYAEEFGFKELMGTVPYNPEEITKRIETVKNQWGGLPNEVKEKYRSEQLKKPYYPPMLSSWS